MNLRSEAAKQRRAPSVDNRLFAHQVLRRVVLTDKLDAWIISKRASAHIFNQHDVESCRLSCLNRDGLLERAIRAQQGIATDTT
jgi:hypothetical protein